MKLLTGFEIRKSDITHSCCCSDAGFWQRCKKESAFAALEL